MIAIPARADNPQAAWQYVETMLSPEGQEEHFAETGTFPAAEAALESDEIREYQNEFFGDSAIGEIISDSVLEFNSFYNGPDTSAIGAALLNVLVDMEAGNVDPADAWGDAVASANAAIGG